MNMQNTSTQNEELEFEADVKEILTTLSLNRQ